MLQLHLLQEYKNLSPISLILDTFCASKSTEERPFHHKHVDLISAEISY